MVAAGTVGEEPQATSVKLKAVIAIKAKAVWGHHFRGTISVLVFSCASSAPDEEWNFMGLILLEALLALVVLIAIVWWTMFSGRKRGELDIQKHTDSNDKPQP